MLSTDIDDDEKLWEPRGHTEPPSKFDWKRIKFAIAFLMPILIANFFTNIVMNQYIGLLEKMDQMSFISGYNPGDFIKYIFSILLPLNFSILGAYLILCTFFLSSERVKTDSASKKFIVIQAISVIALAFLMFYFGLEAYFNGYIVSLQPFYGITIFIFPFKLSLFFAIYTISSSGIIVSVSLSKNANR